MFSNDVESYVFFDVMFIGWYGFFCVWNDVDIKFYFVKWFWSFFYKFCLNEEFWVDSLLGYGLLFDDNEKG